MCKRRTFPETRAVKQGAYEKANIKHSHLTNNKLQEESRSSPFTTGAEVMPPPADTAASTCTG